MVRGVVAMVPMGLSKHGKEPPYSWRSLCGTQVLSFNKGDGDLIRIDTALIRAQSGTAFFVSNPPPLLPSATLDSQ
ncbi:hypothetical protein IVA96_07730 [Bradyrhizobium sp. 159]|uniref:hypothetical protein n=1 Tax=Bradyrhizobium sp. 159 TaxID=2782632 RepID=UPI001FFAB2AE|nr:hypothetical protein [Bradyrhizobium sp. 159]MCK1616541.1 hypothetical protein [Bradyrhizobium sp. 159]